jgi:hypothetical protein
MATDCWFVFPATGIHRASCCEVDVVAFRLPGRRIEAEGNGTVLPALPDIAQAATIDGLGAALDLAYKLIATPSVLIDVKAQALAARAWWGG